MYNAGKKLLLSVLLTAAVMALMIHLLFTLPARRQSQQLAGAIRQLLYRYLR